MAVLNKVAVATIIVGALEIFFSAYYPWFPPLIGDVVE
jgi:hypothetical protein